MASYSRLTREWWQSLGANHILLKPKLPSHYTSPLSIFTFLFSFSPLSMWSASFTLLSKHGNVLYSLPVLLFQGGHFFIFIFLVQKCIWGCPCIWRTEPWYSRNPQQSDLKGCFENILACVSSKHGLESQNDLLKNIF